MIEARPSRESSETQRAIIAMFLRITGKREFLNHVLVNVLVVRGFREKFAHALPQVLAAQEHRELLECFRFVYEYRRGFGWLAESEKNGLVGALERALFLYGYPTSRQSDPIGKRVVDDHFKQGLIAAG